MMWRPCLVVVLAALLLLGGPTAAVEWWRLAAAAAAANRPRLCSSWRRCSALGVVGGVLRVE